MREVKNDGQPTPLNALILKRRTACDGEFNTYAGERDDTALFVLYKKTGGETVNIFAEVTIDETGIIKQIDAVKEAADRFEDEALKLHGMLAQANAAARVLYVWQAFRQNQECTGASYHIQKLRK